MSQINKTGVETWPPAKIGLIDSIVNMKHTLPIHGKIFKTCFMVCVYCKQTFVSWWFWIYYGKIFTLFIGLFLVLILYLVEKYEFYYNPLKFSFGDNFICSTRIYWRYG